MHEWANSNQGLITRGGPTQPTSGTFTEHTAQVIKETVPLGLLGHLLQKATIPKRSQHIYLLYTNKQKDNQNGETKKHAQMNRRNLLKRST